MAEAFIARRITAEMVHEALGRAQYLLPGRRPVLLHDDPGLAARLPDLPAVECGPATPIEALAAFALPDSVFLYACNFSFNGLRFATAVTHAGGRYVVVPAWGGFGSFADQDPHLAAVLNFEHARQCAEGYDKFDVPDFIEICQALQRTRHIDGDFVEIGCYRGSSGSVALNYLGASGIARTCWFLDVFEGFDYDAARNSADAHWQGTHATEGMDVVAARLQRYARPDAGLHVHVVRSNVITEELPKPIRRIAVANIDVDMYEAVQAALVKVRRRLAPGGIMLVEDVSHTPGLVGALVALEEFMLTPDAKGLFRLQLPNAQTLLLNLDLGF